MAKLTPLQKEVKKLEFYYTIKLRGYGNFVRRTARGIAYNYSQPKHIFETETQAQKKLDKIKNNQELYIQKIDTPITIYV